MQHKQLLNETKERYPTRETGTYNRQLTEKTKVNIYTPDNELK